MLDLSRLDKIKGRISGLKNETAMAGLVADAKYDEAIDFTVDVSLAKRGATVVSIDMENYTTTGGKKITNEAVLGYFYGVKQRFDGLQIQFATRESVERKNGSLKLEPEEIDEWIEHPLSRAGYSVPMNGGVVVADFGYTILVSREGKFRGQGGWQTARENYMKYLREVNRSNELTEEIENKTAHLRMLTEESLKRGILLNEWAEYARKVQNMAINLQSDLVKYRQEKETLLASLGQLTNVNQSLRNRIKQTIADVDVRISDINTYIHSNLVDDSLMASTSNHPKISKLEQKAMMERWKKEGIIADEDEVKELKEENHKLKAILGKIQQQMQNQKQNSGGRNAKEPDDEQGDSGDGEDDTQSGNGDSEDELEGGEEDGEGSESPDGVSGNDEDAEEDGLASGIRRRKNN